MNNLAEKKPLTPRLNRTAILILMRMFKYVTYYLIAGTIYCWVTIIQDKLKNVYT